MKEFVKLAVKAALDAGDEILEVYKHDFSVETKPDQSPLTLADKRAHEAIRTVLGNASFPILSEEGKQTAYDERREWDTFWLVDPLDGTKEFIKKNGEFTVNIALIRNGVPQLGVVFVPVTGTLYFGYQGAGSYIFTIKDKINVLLADIMAMAQKLPSVKLPEVYTIVASRSHNTPETETFIEESKAKHGHVDLINSGSSIKLCLVAEGKAHVYPRLAPTMEWDTAAGHAVAKFAGCRVFNFATQSELVYNKENLLNPYFVVEKV